MGPISSLPKGKKKVKLSHYRREGALGVPGGWGSRISRQSAHEGGKVVSLTHRPPLPQERFLVLISVRGWVDPRAHNATGRIKSLKNSSDSIGNRTCDLPVCSAVPQPTAPLRTPSSLPKVMKNPEALTFRITKGLFMPVAGKRYLYLYPVSDELLYGRSKCLADTLTNGDICFWKPSFH
jgi:hypothetical protein